MTDVSLAEPPFAVAPSTARTVRFELPGEPCGKGRPRFVRATGHAYTPAKTVSYEGMLRHEAHMAMDGQPLLEYPIRVHVVAWFTVPASWSQKKRAAALLGTIRPTKKPDADNVLKMLDALNGIVWRDDSQIVTALVQKYYSAKPCLIIEVGPV